MSDDLFSNLSTVLAQLRDENADQLSGRAGCAAPSTVPGESFLESVRDNVLEVVEGLDADDLVRLASDKDGQFLDDDGSTFEAVDGSVPIYSHDVWSTFVDLGAFGEDLDDLGGATNDLEQNAKVALFLIGERLAWSVVGSIGDDLKARPYDEVLSDARDMGADHGQAAAEWWAQDTIGGRASGDVTSMARRVLDGLDEGDPEVLDGLPRADLSGEWADGTLPRDVYEEVGLSEDVDDDTGEALDAFCEGFDSAVAESVAAACRAVLSED